MTLLPPSVSPPTPPAGDPRHLPPTQPLQMLSPTPASCSHDMVLECAHRWHKPRCCVCNSSSSVLCAHLCFAAQTHLHAKFPCSIPLHFPADSIPQKASLAANAAWTMLSRHSELEALLLVAKRCQRAPLCR